jgi:hypothetical protein
MLQNLALLLFRSQVWVYGYHCLKILIKTSDGRSDLEKQECFLITVSGPVNMLRRVGKFPLLSKSRKCSLFRCNYGVSFSDEYGIFQYMFLYHISSSHNSCHTVLKMTMNRLKTFCVLFVNCWDGNEETLKPYVSSLKCLERWMRFHRLGCCWKRKTWDSRVANG